jgi:carbon-monoxide dehydrogenase large subunit
MALTTTVRVPAASMRGRAVLTNTSPTTSYHSAGRPEVMFVMERLIDLAARRHGFDRLELRRKNLVPAAKCPRRRIHSACAAAAKAGRRWRSAPW